MSEATKKSDPQAAEPSEALAHWQAQEQAAQPLDDEEPPAADPRRGEWRMPSGWWIAPAIVTGIWLWVRLFRLIF